MTSPLHLVDAEDADAYKYHPAHDYLYMILLDHRRDGETVVEAAKRILETMALDICETGDDLCDFLKFAGSKNRRSTFVHRLRVKWGAPLPRGG